MNYTLVFDVAESGHSDWSGVATGLLCVGVGAFLVWKRRKLPTMFPGGMGPKAASAFAYVFLAFSFLVTIGMLTTTWSNRSTLRDALQRGNAQVVEGRVEEFKPMPYAGHAQEHFTVCGVPFSYSDDIETGGFNRSSSHGGPVRAGLWVRISYVRNPIADLGNTIARLEIATKDPGEQAECAPSPVRH